MSEKYKMTVEAPVHLTIEFDDPMQVDEDTDPVGLQDTHRIVEQGVPTDEFKQAVKDKLESESVSVNQVHAASGWNVSSDD